MVSPANTVVDELAVMVKPIYAPIASDAVLSRGAVKRPAKDAKVVKIPVLLQRPVQASSKSVDAELLLEAWINNMRYEEKKEGENQQSSHEAT